MAARIEELWQPGWGSCGSLDRGAVAAWMEELWIEELWQPGWRSCGSLDRGAVAARIEELWQPG